MAVNLTAKVILNNNPLQIQLDNIYAIYGWNHFQRFLQAKKIVNDPKLNTNEGKSQFTDELIKEYNSGTSIINNVKFNYATIYPAAIIDDNSIIKAQKYHKISDLNVVIDGWVGSQTSQLIYPLPYAIYQGELKTNFPIDKNGVIPVIWGNQRYVINAGLLYKKLKVGDSYQISDLIPYDESKYLSTLQTKSLPKEWNKLGNNLIVSKTPLQINNDTKNDATVKNNIQNQTSLVTKITP